MNAKSYQDKFIKNYLNALEKKKSTPLKNSTDLRQRKINETANAWKRTISNDHVTTKKDIESDHEREVSVEEYMNNLKKMNGADDSSDDLREKARRDNENAWRKTVGA